MKQFAPPRAKIIELDGNEWMGGIWINEGIGFTSVSRHRDTPDEAGGLEVDFSELPESAVLAIFDAIHLRLRPGLTLQEVRSILGKPEKTLSFVSDRKTYDFTVGARYPYYVSATVHDTAGLIYVAVIRRDVLSKINA